MSAGLASAASVKPNTLSPFLERIRADGLGRTVVLHTGRRAYLGKLVAMDAASIRLESESNELDELVRLDVDPRRVEAVEFVSE